MKQNSLNLKKKIQTFSFHKKLSLNFRRISFGIILTCILVPLSILLPEIAFAAKTTPEASAPEPCGIVEDYLGDVQVLDASKANLTDIQLRGIIYCGTSITVGKGWVQLRTQNGSRLHLGEQTFIQFPQSPKRSRYSSVFNEDHLVLFKGQIYVQTYQEDEEFRIVTATGRIRLRKGKIIAQFSPKDEATQLIALEDTASLENRFEGKHRILVNPGESTELNFKLLRVIPQLPTAISVASLRPKLVELEVPEKDLWNAIHATLDRQKKDFMEGIRPSKNKIDRKLASIAAKKMENKINYYRNAAKDMSPELRRQWIEKIVGDKTVGEKILYPNRFYGKRQKAQIQVEDPVHDLTQNLIQKKKSDDDLEKQRLIRELSQIRVE